jgi:hypothetical protein
MGHLGNRPPVKQEDSCFFHWVTGSRVDSHFLKILNRELSINLDIIGSIDNIGQFVL